MRLFITGDTHGPLNSGKLWKGLMAGCAHSLTKDDVLCVLGDFGWCFSFAPEGEEAPYERDGLDAIERLPFTTVFIDGNHENFPRLYQYPTGHKYGGEVGILRPHIYHLKQRGHIYNICGHKIWCMGGAPSFDFSQRTPMKDWWPNEIPSTKELEYGLEQLKQAGDSVDYIFTHDGPAYIVWYLLMQLGARVTQREFERQSPAGYLQYLARDIKYKRWYFGHHHIDVNIAAYGKDFGCGKDNAKQFSCLMNKALELPNNDSVNPTHVLSSHYNGNYFCHDIIACQ